MRLLQADGDRYRFLLQAPEKGAFTAVLRCYPLVPASHHRIRRDEAVVGPGDDERQQLLTEAMTEEKAVLKSRVDRFLSDSDRFVRSDSGYRLDLSRDDLEWLLRVLNDVRVGSWLALGSPEPRSPDAPEPDVEDSHHLAAMETSGALEYVLLEALASDDGV